LDIYILGRCSIGDLSNGEDATLGRWIAERKNGEKKISGINRMNQFKRDLSFGEQSEMEVIEVLSKAFDTELVKNSQYASIDFASDTVEIELKSRNNEKDKYPTTIIPKSKIDYIKKYRMMKKYIFAFRFTDGLYYIEFKDEVFDKYECKMYKRLPRTGIIDKEQLYYYIPVCDLIKIDKILIGASGVGHAEPAKHIRCGATYDA
jgi:hypothetical protein